MGQKVNPIGFRVGVTSHLGVHLVRREKQCTKFLHEDLENP